jgi:hypothetical protein
MLLMRKTRANFFSARRLRSLGTYPELTRGEIALHALNQLFRHCKFCRTNLDRGCASACGENRVGEAQSSINDVLWGAIAHRRWR